MIRCEHLGKRYAGGRQALVDVSCEIAAGEYVVVCGATGSGKTTFIRLLAGLERPSRGSLVVGGEMLSRLGEAALAFYRRKIGVVLQEHLLLQDRNVIENVRLPLDIAGLTRREADARARAAVERTGLAGCERMLPDALSAGERQRAALARALVGQPALLLADEPAAGLDPLAARTILDLLSAFRAAGTTVVVAMHHPQPVMSDASRILRLDAGRLAA